MTVPNYSNKEVYNMSAEYLSYTYLIGWTEHEKYYYGVRTANKTKPENDLWKIYFTSSCYVKKFRELHGEPDLIYIHRTFESSDDARIFEIDTLRKLDILNEDMWLNKSISKSILIDDEVKERISASNKAYFADPEFGEERRKQAGKYLHSTQARKNRMIANRDPKVRKRKSDAAKETQNRPEVKKAKSTRMIERYKDPEERRKMSKIQSIVQNNVGKRKPSPPRKYSQVKRTDLGKIQIDDNIFDNVTDAAKHYEVHNVTISRWIKKGKAKWINQKQFKIINPLLIENSSQKQLLFNNIIDASIYLNIKTGTLGGWIKKGYAKWADFEQPVESYSNNVLDVDTLKYRQKQTNLERYGTEYATQSESVKEKTRQTNLERYGYDSPAKSSIVRQRMRIANPNRKEVIIDGIKYESMNYAAQKLNCSRKTIKK